MDDKKPRKMLKVFKGIGRVLKGAAKGVIDTVIPNTHQTIQVIQPTMPLEEKKINIDYPRLITAVTVWILLILVLAGKISFTDIKDFVINAFNA
jgi:hypothetical protein